MPSKKRSPKEIIEKDDSRIEHSYVKFPGRELVRTTLVSAQDYTEFDIKEVKKLWDQANKVRYTEVHNHPSGRPLPSRDDLDNFLVDDNVRSMVVVQRDDRSGEVKGYFVLRKTKDYRPFGYSKMSENKRANDAALSKAQLPLIEATQSYGSAVYESSRSPEKALWELDKMAKKYGLQYRFVPAKDKIFLREKARFGKLSALEKAVGVFIVGGALFLFLKKLISEDIYLSPQELIHNQSALVVIIFCALILLILNRFRKN